MGGDFYARDVISVPEAHIPQRRNAVSTSYRPVQNVQQEEVVQYSETANRIMTIQKKLHRSQDPKNYSSEANSLRCTFKSPIVFNLDITGSMGNWAKVIYDKLPLFFGEIVLNGYLDDPALSFSATGDAYSDKAPVQVSPFGRGAEIDQLISKIFLEGGGGGQDKETYELTALFHLLRCDISGCNGVPFYFITGDEGFYPSINLSHVKDHLGINFGTRAITSIKVFQELKKKFKGNVFLIHKPFFRRSKEDKIIDDWTRALGSSHVVILSNPKAIIDVTLGIIAMTSGTRTLDEYVYDMSRRNQSPQRINEVKKALLNIPQKKIVSISRNSQVSSYDNPKNFEGIKRQSYNNNNISSSQQNGIQQINAVSHGIIPCRFLFDRRSKSIICQVFLIQHKNGKHWGFPKGIQNQNEDGKKTGERELTEETGLKVIKYLSSKKYINRYRITSYKDIIVDKIVNLRVAEVFGDPLIEEKEVLEATWVDMNKVVLKISYSGERDIFKQVIEEILKDEIVLRLGMNYN